MTIRLIDTGWSDELKAALSNDGTALRIICPFIKRRALEDMLGTKPHIPTQVITRFNLNDYAAGVSDISALRLLLSRGAKVRGVRNLHSKVYLFGDSRAIVTSANLTIAALTRNAEFGFTSADTSTVESCQAYFDNLWNAGFDLVPTQLDDWEDQVTSAQLSGAANPLISLGDYGADIGLAESPLPLPLQAAEAG